VREGMRNVNFMWPCPPLNVNDMAGHTYYIVTILV
jgi:hypothetical protein